MMKYELSERMVWWMMIHPICKVIKEEHSEWDMALLKKRAKRRYREIVEGCDDIGHAWQNTFRMNLVGGAMWFAFYEAANGIIEDGGNMDESLMFDGGMDLQLYEKICNASIASMGWMYKHTRLFNPKKQKGMIDKYLKANHMKSDYNWHTTIVPTGRTDKLDLYFSRCGLCVLARRLKHQELLPVMCKTDYIVASFTDANLHRFTTLAAGDDRCYYEYTQKGSEAERQWQKEHEGDQREQI